MEEKVTTIRHASLLAWPLVAPPRGLAAAYKIQNKAKNWREATRRGASLLFLDHAGFVKRCGVRRENGSITLVHGGL
jgi:hypothetical protein